MAAVLTMAGCDPFPETGAPAAGPPAQTDTSAVEQAAPAPANEPSAAPGVAEAVEPVVASRVEPVTAEQLGSSWKPGLGCPEPGQLRAVVVSHWGYDGAVHEGRLIVAAAHADNMVAVFADLFAARFPIERMVPVDVYGGDDQASMRANNTSAFNCRFVAGTTRLSEHALGQAVDVNPLVNPYVKGGSVDPPEGAAWADRSRQEHGMIRPGDAAVTAFAARGWTWGGTWTTGKDYQHFSAGGR